MTYSEKYVEVLRDNDFKVTIPRVKILEVLDSSLTPLTAQEIHDRLAEHGTDLATIYRSLNKFVDVGILKKLDFGDEYSRYETANRDHHHHIICLSCGKIEKIHHCNIESMSGLIKESTGFTVLSHEVVFKGFCIDCNKK